MQAITLKEISNLLKQSFTHLFSVDEKELSRLLNNVKIIETEMASKELTDGKELTDDEIKKLKNQIKNGRAQIRTQFYQLMYNRIRKHQPIFLWGPPGIGKSAVVKQIADENNLAFIDVRLTTIDPTDLRGLPSIDHKNKIAKWLQAGFLPRDTPKGKRGGIILLDEINAVPSSVQASAYQLVYDKKVGEYEVPDGWFIMAAGNRIGDRGISYTIPSPLANRFTHFTIKVDIQVWLEWAIENELDPMVVAFLKSGFKSSERDSLLYTFDSSKNDIVFATPRTWEYVSNFRYLRNKDMLSYMKAINGTVGEIAGRDFYNFLMLKDTLPYPDRVLAGEAYDLPANLDSLFVLNSMLVESLNQNINTERMNTYMTNFIIQLEDTNKVDFAMGFIHDFLVVFNKRNDKSIFESQELTNFLTRNKNIIGF